MKRMLIGWAVVCSICLPLTVGAQSKPDAETKLDSVPINSTPTNSVPSNSLPLDELFETVSKKTGKKFIVDPRVRAQVNVYGINSSAVSYRELLAILSINNFTAVEAEGLVYVLPQTEARSMPIPTVSGSKQYDDNEFVTKVIPVKSMRAAMLIPALRPMLPQFAHLSAVPCANSIIVVDHYANVKRIQGVIELLDKGEPLRDRDCSTEETRK